MYYVCRDVKLAVIYEAKLEVWLEVVSEAETEHDDIEIRDHF